MWRVVSDRDSPLITVRSGTPRAHSGLPVHPTGTHPAQVDPRSRSRGVWPLCKTVHVAFAQSDIDDLLARTGRLCAVCNCRHGVQVHHIVPRHLGGTDDPSNAIPLCPNCHDEVHAKYAPGRTTRVYTEGELRGHLARTIDLASRQAHQEVGNGDWNHDVELVKFYSNCHDRPAFRTHFHNELSVRRLRSGAGGYGPRARHWAVANARRNADRESGKQAHACQRSLARQDG